MYKLKVMKRNILILLISAMIIMIGCDETRFISATRSTTISDSIQAQVLDFMPNEITGERLLSTDNNEVIAEFEERISDFDVDSLIFSISNYEGDPAVELQQNRLLLLDLERNELLPPIVVPDINLSDFSENNGQYILRFDDEESGIIADSFLTNKGIFVQFRSYITGKPVLFRIKASMYLKVTGEVL